MLDRGDEFLDPESKTGGSDDSGGGKILADYYRLEVVDAGEHIA
jgi:hypothetical protein